jgi:uncharacterized pyridoxal phosphate-containing UPF0001 family protein
MTIPPVVTDPLAARPYFDELATLLAELQRPFPAVRELSMGMTDDFEVAIAAGATIVRIGRAIFA